MNSLRWLLHLCRCWYYRHAWRIAADDYHAARRAVADAQERMNKATAQEVNEARAFNVWRKQVREVAE